MEENLILEGLLSMVTELKEKQEAQVTPASREETLERLNAIEQALSELHSKPAVPEKDLQAIQSQLDEIRNRMQGQQKHIEDTKKIVLETYRCFKVMLDTFGSCKTDKEEATPLPLYQRIYNKVASWIRPGLFLFSAVLILCSASIFLNVRLVERMQQLHELGTRFPDMSQIYDLEFQKIARKAAASLDIDLMEGVYLQLTGPQYESPQEITMCRTLGADAVGMSTACEAIVARHMGMRVIGISCITNLAAGISPQPLCHAEVQEAADMVAPQFKKLVAATIQGIAKTL